VYEIDQLDFDLDQIKRALFESTYRKPVILPFYVGSRDPRDIGGPGVELFMVVELVQAYYAPYAPHTNQKLPIGCFDTPEWYLRGFLYKSGFDVYPEVIRIHAYIATGGAADNINHAIIQIVRSPSEADPTTPLIYGDDTPGQRL
jgi:hypothetical protein